MVPLYKGKGSVTDMNSYRSIAITPPFTKLFMSVINRRLTAYAEEHQLHAPTQAGFRAHHTTTEQALMVQQLIQYSCKTGRALGIVFVDLRKAYDSVPRERLWDALVGELGVPDDLV